MTLDQRGRRAAGALRDDIETIDVPDVGTIGHRARRRDRAGRAMTVAAVVVAAAVGVTAVVVADGDDRSVVDVGASPSGEPPAGSLTERGWTVVPKEEAGLGEGTTFQSLAGDDGSLLLAGGSPGNDDGWLAEIWRSEDGFHWETTTHPAAGGEVTAVATDGEVAVAVGSGGGSAALGQSTFVWRSEDGGRTWTEVAEGSDLFGDPAPEMGRPFVSGLLRHDGWWVASGGGSAGYTGIWISRDGDRWEQVLASQGDGSVNVVEGPDDGLYAYGTRVAWYADDPASWSEDEAVSVPGTFYLGSVAPGAGLAVGSDFERHVTPTPLLRSDDEGRTWAADDSFLDRFPDAWALRISRVAGLWVVAGASGTPNHPDAWVSPDGRTWQAMPEGLYGLPALERRYPRPDEGTVGLVGTVRGRVVLVGTAPELDRFYVLEPGNGATG